MKLDQEERSNVNRYKPGAITNDAILQEFESKGKIGNKIDVTAPKTDITAELPQIKMVTLKERLPYIIQQAIKETDVARLNNEFLIKAQVLARQFGIRANQDFYIPPGSDFQKVYDALTSSDLSDLISLPAPQSDAQVAQESAKYENSGRMGKLWHWLKRRIFGPVLTVIWAIARATMRLTAVLISRIFKKAISIPKNIVIGNYGSAVYETLQLAGLYYGASYIIPRCLDFWGVLFEITSVNGFAGALTRAWELIWSLLVPAINILEKLYKAQKSSSPFELITQIFSIGFNLDQRESGWVKKILDIKEGKFERLTDAIGTTKPQRPMMYQLTESDYAVKDSIYNKKKHLRGGPTPQEQWENYILAKNNELYNQS